MDEKTTGFTSLKPGKRLFLPGPVSRVIVSPILVSLTVLMPEMM